MVKLFREKLNLTNLPDHSVKTIRRLSDGGLHRYIAGWLQGSALRIRGEVELRRRQNWVARWPLGVSMVPLIVSAIALFAKVSSAD
jgi:hypothetical protein